MVRVRVRGRVTLILIFRQHVIGSREATRRVPERTKRVLPSPPQRPLAKARPAFKPRSTMARSAPPADSQPVAEDAAPSRPKPLAKAKPLAARPLSPEPARPQTPQTPPGRARPPVFFGDESD